MPARLMCIVAVVMLSTTALNNGISARKPAAPNVLLIASDDLNNSLGCYGGPAITPNLDRLAKRGVRFDRTYCQFPLCNPSRASFLSGLRPDTTQVLTNGPRLREKLPNVVTLGQLFRQNGYFSARVGKLYHMGVPGGVGQSTHDDPESWDFAFSPPGAEFTSKGEGADRTPGQADGTRFRWVAAENEEDQADYQAASEAIRLLEEKRDKPFFLSVGFVRPHVPLIAPKRYFDLYPPDKIKLPEVPANDRDDLPAPSVQARRMHLGMEENGIRETLRAYYASISFMDAQAGRVLDALDRLKLRDNTIVVFLSDHGYHLGEHGFWQKMSVMEESARVPLMISAPGIKARGKPTRALTELVDVYPTLAGLCGITPPANLEGLSLQPLLADTRRPWKTATFTQVLKGQVTGRAIRTDRFRYIEWDDGSKGRELYDHKTDPKELTNLAADSAHSDVVKEMKRILNAGWKAALPTGKRKT